MEGLEDYIVKLRNLGVHAEGVCKAAVYPAAAIVIEAIKQNTPEGTGDLRESTILTPFEDESGYIHTKVKWVGYDRKGVPNAIKARVLESGRSTPSGGITGKHPFIRRTINKIRGAAETQIEIEFNRIINEIMNK